MSKPRIAKLVENVHMGLGHDGLSEMLREIGIRVENLADNDLIMLINRKNDKMKLLGCQGRVLGYLKMPNGNRIMKEALQYIPQTFGSTGFNYDAACREALYSRLKLSRN